MIDKRRRWGVNQLRSTEMVNVVIESVDQNRKDVNGTNAIY
jgi:hypothetical protein